MKKLILILVSIIALNVNQLSAQGSTAITFTPLTRIEFIAGKPTFTTPIDLKISQLFQIGSSKFHYGFAWGLGFNSNIGTNKDIHAEIPVMALFGGDVLNWAALEVGGGLNAVNGNPIVGAGINLYTFPLSTGSSNERKAEPSTVPAIIHNRDYKETKIGFKHD